jgi:hypothetical protein
MQTKCITKKDKHDTKQIKYGRKFSFCDRARVLIYILKNQLFALKYTLKHSLIKNNNNNNKSKHVGVLINLILMSECFKVYFNAKSRVFLKYK